jgi:hypothetical protein
MEVHVVDSIIGQSVEQMTGNSTTEQFDCMGGGDINCGDTGTGNDLWLVEPFTQLSICDCQHDFLVV